MFIFIAILIIAIVILILNLYKKDVFNTLPDNVDVSQRYDSKFGQFVITGKKKKFVITKDENISFLVEDGQIVACKDKRVSNDFIYYGGN